MGGLRPATGWFLRNKKHKVLALPPRLRHLKAQARTLLLYFGLFLFAVEITTKSRGIVVRHPLQSSSTTSLKGRPQCQSTDKKVTSVAHHPPESSHSPLRRQKSNKPLLRGLVLAGRTKNERETSRGEKDWKNTKRWALGATLDALHASKVAKKA
jgi:hypothetical protein